tara:strand:- start:11998 stop:12405 length:408 start_codon:yes stop_codon:yes gene_type:complete
MHKKGHGGSRGSRKPVEQKTYSSKGSRGDRTPPKKGEPKTAGVGKNRVPTSKKAKEKVTEVVKKRAVKKVGSRGSRKPVEQPTYSSKGVGSRGTRKPKEAPAKKSKNKIIDKLNIKLKKPKSIKMRKTMSGYRRK